METDQRQALLESCRTLLRPVVSLLLRGGLTWREFAELARDVFVEVASDEYGIRGRKTNVSRVAILTGIGRREVARLRRRRPTVPAENRTSDATRVLSGWYQDAAFRSGARPKALHASGGAASFAALARRYAPDVPPSAMLKELRRVGAVEPLADGRVRPVQRYYMPGRFDSQWILNAGSLFGDLGTTINYNLAAERGANSRFIGRATDQAVDPAAVPALREFLEQEGQGLLERVDDWLARHRVGRGLRRIRLGVGLFSIQNDVV
jgi:hypothetical protein